MVDCVNDPDCARGPVLVRQAHGGALMAPWDRRGAQAAGKTGWKRTKREALALLHEATPTASARLIALCASDDERVAVVAINQLLDRALGKPGDLPQGDDGVGGQIDLTPLTTTERDELVAALAVVRELRDLAVSRAGKGRGES